MTESLERSAIHDFDWLHGSWRTKQRRLLHPLTGANEWTEFDATVTSRPIIGGRGTFEEFSAPRVGIAGWTCGRSPPPRVGGALYWMSNRPGPIEPPVVGRFGPDGRGVFECEDPFDGRPGRRTGSPSSRGSPIVATRRTVGETR
jgi:hypothetical protein